MSLRNVGILLFDDIELLDFAGPLQVFSAAHYIDSDAMNVPLSIGFGEPIRVSKSNLLIRPTDVFDKGLKLDLLIIPGGFGTRPILKDEIILTKIETLIQQSKITASVCTGSLILAKLGHLNNKSATTHFGAIDLLQSLDTTITVDRTKRYIDHGNIIVSEGVSAGIDMSFYLLVKYFSKQFSDEVRKYIEYYPEVVGSKKG